MSKEKMAAAAELLRKGGTLVQEACSACKGVQVKYSGKIVCVNCGKEEEVVVVQEKKAEEAPAESRTPAPAEVITELRGTVVTKINELLPTLRSEHDIGRQHELTKLLMSYLEVLEKITAENT